LVENYLIEARKYVKYFVVTLNFFKYLKVFGYDLAGPCSDPAMRGEHWSATREQQHNISWQVCILAF
jgi:hypothetical protein